MTGAIWAAFSGIGFGLFQSVNRKAKDGMVDAYRATFVLLLVSASILVAASIMTENVSMLLDAPLSVYLNFGLAGFIHFFLGWTFINISQVRIGAARTSALIGTTPLFAAIVGVLFFDEFLSGLVLIGIAVVILGAYFITVEPKSSLKDMNQEPVSWRDSIFGFGTAICFTISSIFIRFGLDELSSPLLGVSVGMVISVIAYSVVLVFRRKKVNQDSILRTALYFQILAGIFVGVSTWMRWVALDLAPLGVVISLGRLNVPIVLFLAPVLVGSQVEKITARIWIGAILIVAGSLLLILY